MAQRIGRSRMDRKCEAAGCDRAHRARGLCRRHYRFKYEMHDATCVTCGTKFKAMRDTGKYCSDDCKALDYMGKPKPPRLSPLPHEHPVMQMYRLPEPWAPRCELPPTHPVIQRQQTWVAGSCEWCGNSFVALMQTSHRYRYCSRRCSTDAGRLRRGRFTIPRTRRLAIYERDQWTCQLCDGPVDKALPTSDIWSATLDHIVCQSWTDVPDHSDDNLRLAHRWCNSVRADERHHTAAALAA